MPRADPWQDEHMTTNQTTQTTFDRNMDTVRGWVEAASGGVLTAVWHTAGSTSVSIRRADGAPLDGPKTHDYGDHVITGYGTTIYVSSVRRMDRRWRTTMTEVRDAVRSVLVGYVADVPMDAWSALSMFEHRNRLR